MPKLEPDILTDAQYNAAINDGGLNLAFDSRVQDLTLTQNERYTLTLPRAVGGIGDYEYFVDGLPVGATANVGEVDVPTIDFGIGVVGDYVILIGVSDGVRTVITQSFTVTVNPPRTIYDVSIIDNGVSPVPDGVIELTARVVGQDFSTAAYDWEVVGGSIRSGGNAATLQLPDEGFSVVTLTAEIDGVTYIVTRTYIVQVGAEPGQTLTVASISGNTLLANTSIVAEFAANVESALFDDAVPIIYSWITTLTGVTLDGTSTQTATLRVPPGMFAEQSGTLTVNVSRGALTATRTIDVTIVGRQLTKVLRPSAPRITEGLNQLTVARPLAVGGSGSWRYRYRLGTSGPWQGGNIDQLSTVESVAITGLEGGREYQVQVLRRSSDVALYEDSDWSPSTVATPTNVIVLATPTAAVSAITYRGWTITPQPFVAQQSGWQHRYRTGGGNWVESPVLTTTAAAVITTGEDGTTYEVQVRRVTTTPTYGNSPWSQSVGVRTLAIIKLETPTVVTRGDPLPTSFVLTKPSAVTGQTGWQHRHRLIATPEEDWTTSAILPEADAVSTIRGLRRGTRYEVQVRRTTTTGGFIDSDWSPSETVTTSGIIQLPTPLAPSFAGSNDIYRPVNAAGWPLDDDVDSLFWQWRTRIGAGGWTEGVVQEQDIRTVRTADDRPNVSGLTNGTVYQIQVRRLARGDALVNYSDSDWSATTTFTAGNGLATFMRTLATPDAPTITGVTVNSMRVTRPTAIDTTGENWAMRYRAAGASAWVATRTDLTSGAEDITGLDLRTTYEVQVRVDSTATGWLDSEWSESSNATTSPVKLATPSAPAIDASRVTDSTMIVTRPTAVTGGTNWQMRHREDGTDDWTQSGRNIGAAADLLNLDRNTTYEVQVRLLADSTSYVTSDWSASTTRTTRQTRLLAPPPPVVSDITQNSFVVAKPTPDVAEQTHWRYQWRTPPSTLRWGAAQDPPDGDSGSLPLTQLTADVTGLARNTEYQIRVRRVSDNPDWIDGIGGSTTVRTLNITKLATPAAPTLTPQGAPPRIGIAYPQRPTGAASLEYRWRQGISGPWSDPVSITAAATLSNLAAGTTYQVQTRWKASSSLYADSEWSEAATVVTLVVRLPTAPAPVISTSANVQLRVRSDGFTVDFVNIQRPPATGVGGYEAEWREGTTGDWNTASQTPGDPREVPVRGLDAGTQHQVRIRYIPAAGDTHYEAGNWSPITTFSTTAA